MFKFIKLALDLFKKPKFTGNKNAIYLGSDGKTRYAEDETKPKTFEAAMYSFCRLIMNMKAESRESLLSLPTADLFSCVLHSGLGRSIRNHWDLWDKCSAINIHFYKRWKIDDGDDISAIIMKCSWQALNGLELTPDKFADECLKFRQSLDIFGE